MEEKLEVGKIFALHGKKKVKASNFIDVDVFKSLCGDGHLFLADSGFSPKSFSFYKNIVFFEFDESFDIAGLIGQSIFARREDLGEGLLVGDVLGLDVFDKSFKPKHHYGKIIDIQDFGAGMLIEVLPNGKNAKESEFYRFDDDTFPKVDVVKGYAILRRPTYVETELPLKNKSWLLKF